MIILSPNQFSKDKNDRIITVIESLLKKDTSYVRTIIWGLTYNPDKVLDLVKPLKGFTNKELKFARNEIRANYEREKKFPIFGFFESPGTLDFCRKDAIAKDMICMMINTYLEQATPTQSDRLVILFSNCRIQFVYGGIREIGFSKDEADYLINIIDTINLSKYIDKVIKAKEEEKTKKAKKEEKESLKEDLIKPVIYPETSLEKNSSFSKEEFAKNVLKNLDDIEHFFALAEKLEKGGIPTTTLIEKKKTILKLLELKNSK